MFTVLPHATHIPRVQYNVIQSVFSSHYRVSMAPFSATYFGEGERKCLQYFCWAHDYFLSYTHNFNTTTIPTADSGR